MEKNKKQAAFKISPSEPTMPISALDLPWQQVDRITGNCPTHIGVRLNRVNDETYICPKGKEVYSPRGSITNQTNRDNYYLGIILKGPGIMPSKGKI
jgi:hypothetical protein